MYGMDLCWSGDILSSFLSSISKYSSHFNIHESRKIREQCKCFIIYEHQQLVLFLSTLRSVLLDLSDLFRTWPGLLQATVATLILCVSIQNVLLFCLRPELRYSREKYPSREEFFYSLHITVIQVL